MDRREILRITGFGFFGAGLIRSPLAMAQADVTLEILPLNLSDAEWKKRLTPEVYYILRQEGTERPYTSPLSNEHREGVYACAGCNLVLFDSSKKYESHTGWPSFFDVKPGRIKTKDDYKIGVRRTEYHCARCGGHQGHRFDDGPKPTGFRYCNNGLALRFVPKKT